MADEPAVSVLTAALAPESEFLAEAYDSLCEQDGVTWEWLIQLDGHDGYELPAGIQGDQRVSVESNGQHLGAAGTRNRGLLRSRAPLVQNLDADDQMLPCALRAGVTALQADPELAFAFGRTVHLRPDGSREPAWLGRVPFPPGRIEAGEIDGYWLTTGSDPLPISPIIWRKGFVFAYGGWAALAILEDTALVLAVASRHPCSYLDLDTQLYRLHGTQATVAADYRRARHTNLRFVFERLRALAELQGRADGFPEPPADPADLLDDRALRRGV